MKGQTDEQTNRLTDEETNRQTEMILFDRNAPGNVSQSVAVGKFRLKIKNFVFAFS